MKRLFLLLLISALLLTGCAGSGPSITEESEICDPTPGLYTAAAQVYDWFDLTTMPLDETDSRLENGLTYYRVASPDFPDITTVSALAEFAGAYFSPEIVEHLLSLSPEHYRDFDGVLYAVPADRGANPCLLDKTVTAEPLDKGHWAMTLTFWADVQDRGGSGTPDTGLTGHPPASATVGYSQTVLDLEKTERGWIFTSFCPSDALDTDAETVYPFTYTQPLDAAACQELSDEQLAFYLLHAIGDYTAGPQELLFERFMERPGDVLAALTTLYRSPYQDKYRVMETPGSSAPWLLPWEEQAVFSAVLDSCVPKTEDEAAVLDIIRAGYAHSREVTYWLPFCLEVNGRHLFLGPQSGEFPWGCDLDEVSRETGGGDGFGTVYTVDCGTLTLRYGAADAGSGEFLYSVSTDMPGTITLNGVGVGCDEAAVQTAYPTAEFTAGCSVEGGSGAWVWPGGESLLGGHITFYIKAGKIARIEMEYLAC